MRTATLASAIVWLALTNSSAQTVAPVDSAKTVPEKKPFIQFHVLPKNFVMLEIRQPGTIQRPFKVYIIGEVSFEETGLRYIPATTSPEGYISQDLFEKKHWYNSQFKEVFIPYEHIKSFKKHWGSLRTKDGRKYRFASREMKDLTAKIRSHITE